MRKRLGIATAALLLGVGLAGCAEDKPEMTYREAGNQCYDDLYAEKAQPTEACAMLTEDDLSILEAGVALEKQREEDPEFDRQMDWLEENYGQ